MCACVCIDAFVHTRVRGGVRGMEWKVGHGVVCV